MCACVVLTFLGEFDGMGACSLFCFSCVCGFSGFFSVSKRAVKKERRVEEGYRGGRDGLVFLVLGEAHVCCFCISVVGA